MNAEFVKLVTQHKTHHETTKQRIESQIVSYENSLDLLSAVGNPTQLINDKITSFGDRIANRQAAVTAVDEKIAKCDALLTCAEDEQVCINNVVDHLRSFELEPVFDYLLTHTASELDTLFADYTGESDEVVRMVINDLFNDQ